MTFGQAAVQRGRLTNWQNFAADTGGLLASLKPSQCGWSEWTSSITANMGRPAARWGVGALTNMRSVPGGTCPGEGGDS